VLKVSLGNELKVHNVIAQPRITFHAIRLLVSMAVQANRDRNGIYQYLAAVFELVKWWEPDQKEIKYAHRAFHLHGHGDEAWH